MCMAPTAIITEPMMARVSRLSAPAPRRHMHIREVQCDGYRRDDGLWDIEASIIDRKTYAYTEPERGRREPGSEVHHMAIRLTLGTDFVIRAVEVVLPATPYAYCGTAAPNYQGLVGRRIDGKWRATVNEIVGAARGCTHARELLFPMATSAFQSLFGWREEGSEAGSEEPRMEMRDKTGKPYFVGGCKAWAEDGPVVARFYPQFASAPTPRDEPA